MPLPPKVNGQMSTIPDSASATMKTLKKVFMKQQKCVVPNAYMGLYKSHRLSIGQKVKTEVALTKRIGENEK